MVTQSYYPRLGGVTEHVHNLSEGLRALGHQVEIITSGPAGQHETSTTRIGRNTVFPKNGALVNVTLGLGLARRLRQEFLTNGFDLIHIQCPLEPTLPLAALTACGSVPQPVVGTFHTAASGSAVYDVFSTLLARRAARLDARIAVSPTAREFALKYFPGEYTVIPNGVAYQRFASCRERVADLVDGTINFLFVGRLDVRKQVPWLISAFRKVHARNPRTRLVIVGKGLTEPLCRLAARGPAAGSIVFEGTVYPQDLPRYYNSADVFCSVPSGSESFGLVLLEAMAAGRPVIATDIKGYRDVVTDGAEGTLVPPGDTDALVRAMERLAGDATLREAMGTLGRSKAGAFDWMGIARRVELLYTGLVEARSPR